MIVTFSAPCLQSIGLFLDIVGFALLFAFGHTVFIRVVQNAPGPGANNRYLYLVPGASDPKGESRNKRHRALAYVGVGLIMIGFVLQLIASLYTLFR